MAKNMFQKIEYGNQFKLIYWDYQAQ